MIHIITQTETLISLFEVTLALLARREGQITPRCDQGGYRHTPNSVDHIDLNEQRLPFLDSLCRIYSRFSLIGIFDR